MKNPWLWLVAGVCAIVCSSFLAYPMLKRMALHELSDPTPVMEAGVTVRHGYSSGSGVHIGGGYILTGDHVIRDGKEIIVEYFGGGQVRAEVLWSNKQYDVALLHVERKRWDAVAPLNCEPNFVGQRVTAVGNPMGGVFAYTRLEINGAPRKVGPWARAVPVNGAVIPGQSGGGVVNERGETVGIAIGVLSSPYGMAAFGWIVPAETICMLMARA